MRFLFIIALAPGSRSFVLILFGLLITPFSVRAEGPFSANEAATRISTLRAEIAYHDQLYYEQAAPEISDTAYDQLKEELRRLESNFPEAAATVDSALPLFGDDRTGQFLNQRHLVPLLSLEKAYTMADLEAFAAKVAAGGDADSVTYLFEPKYDGLAISLTYEEGKFVRAVTRGNGIEGSDLTTNVTALVDFPHILDTATVSAPQSVELRGEIYLPKEAFARINREHIAAGLDPFATPRNLAVGTLRSTDPQRVAHRDLALVVFGWGAWIPPEDRPETLQAFRSRLKMWGLPVAEPTLVVDDREEFVDAIEHFVLRRASLPYPTDGIVVKVDRTDFQDRLGIGEDAPRWAVAYKFATEQGETQLIGIHFQVGRTGRLTPVAELTPVKLGGTVVTRASLHRAGEIEALDLRIGDTVVVEKAGDIIPVIVEVRLDQRPDGLEPFSIPTHCPSCGSALDYNQDQNRYTCINTACPAQAKRRIEYFAHVLGIDGLGPRTVEKLVESEQIQSPADLYTLRSGAVPTSVERSIQNSLTASLDTLIAALGIPGIGPASARDFANCLIDFETFAGAQSADFAPGGVAESIRPATAESYLKWKSVPSNARLLKKLGTAGFEHTGSTSP